MQTLEEQFNTRLNAFLGSTGLRPTTLGMKALGDPSLLRQIERGRSPSLRTADRILAFVADYDLDSGGPRTPPRGHRRPEAFVTGEENEEEQSDDRRATYGRTGVRKRRGGPMRTLALRRCARVLRSKPRHGHVLRLHVQAEYHDASYRPLEPITYCIPTLYDLHAIPRIPHNVS